MIVTILLIILGLVAGALSGLIGVGGGVIIVPALVYVFGLSQQQAQGTTLALLIPPIGFIAAWQYYKQGFVDIRIAILIIVGFMVGSLVGSRYAVMLPARRLSRIFGLILLVISIKMIFTK